MTPKIDLEETIRESYALIRGYMDMVRLSSDPLEMHRARRAIENQQALITDDLTRYATLCKALGYDMAEDIAEIAISMGIEVIRESRAVSEPHPPPPTSVTDNEQIYETALDILLDLFGSDHPRYRELVRYQGRLLENLRPSDIYGHYDTTERRTIIEKLDDLALSEVDISFRLLCNELSQLEERWSGYEETIRNEIQRYDKVSVDNLEKIHPSLRRNTLQRYASAYTTRVQVIEDQRGYLHLITGDRVIRWQMEWNIANQSLNTQPGFTGSGKKAVNELANILAELLGLNLITFKDFQTVRACLVEAPALRLKLPPRFPLVFVADPQPGPRTVQMLVDAIDVLRETGYFALVVPLEPPVRTVDVAEQLRQAIKQSPHVQDLIVLSQNDILDILVSRNPSQALTRCIVNQVDLSVIAPFVTSGPVPETMFFGREAEVRLLVESAGKGDFAIVGNRKIGNRLEQRLALLRSSWPDGAPWPELYTRPVSPDDPQSALHAKLALADQQRMLVTSANLTYHGLTGNVEVGVLVDGQVAADAV